MAHHAPWPCAHVEWDGPLPKPKDPAIPILKLMPCTEYDLRVISTRGVAVCAHWNGERTLPCADKTGLNCWYDHFQKFAETRYQYWLHVVNRLRKCQNLICLGKMAPECAPELLDKKVNLRGAHLKVWRGTKGTRGGIMVKLTLQPDLADALVGECDLKAVLAEMWTAPLHKDGEVCQEDPPARKQGRKRSTEMQELAAPPEPSAPGPTAAQRAEIKRLAGRGGAK